MKPEYDDSITGFNECWDIVRETFKESGLSDSMIAAAPEMCEVLKAIVDFCDDPNPIPTVSLALGLSKLLIPARAVLAKAVPHD